MIKELFDDLKLPIHYKRAQKARRKACLLAGMILGASIGLGLYFTGHLLIQILVGSIPGFLLTTAVFLVGYTTVIKDLAKWIKEKRALPAANSKEIKQCQEIRERIKSLRETEFNDDTIKELKKNFKELFSMRAFNPAEIMDIDEDYHLRLNSLLNQIKKHEDWGQPSLKNEVLSFVVTNILYTDTLLACLERELQEANKELTPENVAARLVNQDEVSKYVFNQPGGYCYKFMYTGIAGLYSQTRARVIKEKVEGTNNYKYVTSTADQDKFYTPNTTENMVRKLYNTFIKHGFYQRYGNEAFKETMMRNYPAGDKRFVSWTKKDSKKDKAFYPFPTTRPT